MKNTLPKICVIQAPCKINLHLEIGEKRPDGFHNLRSIFAALALSDTLRFESLSGAGESALSINQQTGGEVIAPRDNLVLKAVSLFRRRSGFRPALRIHLDKRIPVGAGLGGGSSDAASTLLALNLLSGKALPMRELKEMAALLGSDVPFFLAGGTAFTSGRGERLARLKTPAGFWVLLVKPPFSSGTANAYRLLDEARERGSLEGKPPQKQKPLSKKNLTGALETSPAEWPFYNDFLPVFLGGNAENAGIYRDILERLREAGALFSGLSGSGSCCFGIFSAEKMAKKAEICFFSTKNEAKLTFFIAQRAHPILEY